jgi:YVTN family beta-propeller protein
VGVAVTPDEEKVYVTNSDDNTVSVINTSKNAVIATVNVGSVPVGIAVTPDGTRAYVVNWNDNNVSVINTATDNVIDTVNIEYSPVAFGQFIGEKPVLEPLLPVSNLTDNVTPGVNVGQTAEPTQSSDTSGKGNTKIPGFEITSVVTSLLGALLYKHNKRR